MKKEEKRSWYDAQRQCRRKNMRLLVATKEHELQLQYLQKGLAAKGQEEQAYWVGLTNHKWDKDII